MSMASDIGSPTGRVLVFGQTGGRESILRIGLVNSNRQSEETRVGWQWDVGSRINHKVFLEETVFG